MSDTEKIALITQMISDFWEFHDVEKLTDQAEVFVTAIYSVANFEGEANG